MGKHTSWAVVLVLALAACNQNKDDGAAQSKEQQAPPLTMDQMLEFDKGERAALVQRCLGVQDKTCTDFKSETFKTRDGLAKTFCEMEEVQRLSKGAAKAQPRKVKCDVYY